MRHGLVDLVFEVHRGFEAERAVAPRPVVKDFDPLEAGRAGFGARGELVAIHEFAFEAAPAAFPGGVVITVAPAAHARHGSSLRQPLPLVAAGPAPAASA
jgi:hypothetical protein